MSLDIKLDDGHVVSIPEKCAEEVISLLVRLNDKKATMDAYYFNAEFDSIMLYIEENMR